VYREVGDKTCGWVSGVVRLTHRENALASHAPYPGARP